MVGGEKGFTWCLGWLFQRSRDAMQGAEPENAAQCALAAPGARRGDGYWARDVVFMVVHIQSQWAFEELQEWMSIRKAPDQKNVTYIVDQFT